MVIRNEKVLGWKAQMPIPMGIVRASFGLRIMRSAGCV